MLQKGTPIHNKQALELFCSYIHDRKEAWRLFSRMPILILFI